MPRLCILTQYYLPEMGAPQGRLSEMAERLVDRGWHVDVLTALPNYPAAEFFPQYDPNRPCVETIGRVRVARVPFYLANRGVVARIRSYLSFSRAAVRHGPRLCERPDLVYAETPPLFAGGAARRLARGWRCPLVVNVSDLWVESAIRMGVVNRGFCTRLAERYELQLFRSAAGVTGQSAGIVRSVARRCPRLPVAEISNGVDLSRFQVGECDPELRLLLGRQPGPIFIYAGLIGMAQGLQQLLDLAQNLPKSVPGRIVIVGDGPCRSELEKQAADRQINRLQFVAPQPRDRIASLLGVADAAIIPLGMSLPGAVPSKIYEAMAAGLPILLLADGEAAQRIRQAGCGRVVEPGNLAAAQREFTELASDSSLRATLGEAGRKAVARSYSRDNIAARLDQFLRARLASSGAAGRPKRPRPQATYAPDDHAEEVMPSCQLQDL